MDDREFDTLAESALAALESGLEAVGADLDFERRAGGVLEIDFADGGKIIINRHGPAREIWLAARSGGFHFRWANGQWRDTRDGEALSSKLSRLISEQAGETVQLPAQLS